MRSNNLMREPEWAPEHADEEKGRRETRSARVLSIEELRARLGVVGAERPAPAPAMEARPRPRIVWRREDAMETRAAPEIVME
jgi:hypothetical protein